MSAHDLDSRLTQALETPPIVRVPAGFAARVALRTAAERPALVLPGTARLARFGPVAIRVAIAVLLVAMVVSARVQGSLALESTLAAEFIALTVWISLRPKSIG